MNSIPSSPFSAAIVSGATADRRVFWQAVGVAIGVHLVALALFRAATEPRATAQPLAASLRLLPLRTETDVDALQDPSLIVMPSPRGFSSGALAQSATSPMPPPAWRERAETLPNLLADRSGPLVRELKSHERLVSAADRLPPRSQEEPLSPVASTPTRTTFRLMAHEAERKLIGQPVLPLLDYAAPRDPTLLRLGVNGAGAVVTVLLDKTCGNEATDQLAMRDVQSWRFETSRPLRSVGEEEGLDWLTVTISWASASAKPEAKP